MKRFLITYADNTKKEVSAVIFNNVLCTEKYVQNGWETQYRRKNVGDEYDPEYETVAKKVQKFTKTLIPFLNTRNGDAAKLAKLAKAAKNFSDYNCVEKCFVHIGENNGFSVEEITAHTIRIVED